jgi:hypothetical protein
VNYLQDPRVLFGVGAAFLALLLSFFSHRGRKRLWWFMPLAFGIGFGGVEGRSRYRAFVAENPGATLRDRLLAPITKTKDTVQGANARIAASDHNAGEMLGERVDAAPPMPAFPPPAALPPAKKRPGLFGDLTGSVDRAKAGVNKLEERRRLERQAGDHLAQ